MLKAGALIWRWFGYLFVWLVWLVELVGWWLVGCSTGLLAAGERLSDNSAAQIISEKRGAAVVAGTITLL